MDPAESQSPEGSTLEHQPASTPTVRRTRAITKGLSGELMPPPNSNQFVPLYPNHQHQSSTNSKRRAASPPGTEPPKRKRIPMSKAATRGRDRSVTPASSIGGRDLEAIDPAILGSSSGDVGSGQWKTFVGKDGRTTAEDVIVNYLCEGTNYARYKVNNAKGKEGQALDIIENLKREGIEAGKKASQVMSKIRTLVENWKKAHKALHVTGNGEKDEDTDDDESLGSAERAQRFDKKQACKTFMTKFAKDHHYYHQLAPILGSRTVNAPRTLLDSTLPRSQMIEGQIGVSNSRVTPSPGRSQRPNFSMLDEDNIDVAQAGQIEDQPEYIAAFQSDYGGSDDEDPDDNYRSTPTPVSSLLRPNQVSPSNSLTSTSTRAETLAPSTPSRKPTGASARDIGARALASAQKPKVKEKNGDIFGGLAEVMQQKADLDRQTLIAEQEWRKEQSRREAAALERDVEQRQAQMQLEREDQEAKAKLAERQMELELARFEQEKEEKDTKRKAKQARAEKELLAERMKAFHKLRAAGLSSAEARVAAGLGSSE